MDQITVAFDCDGTLVDFFSGKPRYDIVALFHGFQRRGCVMMIWSRTGTDHARETMERLGLRAKIVEKGSLVPDVAVDDEEKNLGRVNIPA